MISFEDCLSYENWEIIANEFSPNRTALYSRC